MLSQLRLGGQAFGLSQQLIDMFFVPSNSSKVPQVWSGDDFYWDACVSPSLQCSKCFSVPDEYIPPTKHHYESYLLLRRVVGRNINLPPQPIEFCRAKAPLFEFFAYKIKQW